MVVREARGLTLGPGDLAACVELCVLWSGRGQCCLWRPQGSLELVQLGDFTNKKLEVRLRFSSRRDQPGTCPVAPSIPDEGPHLAGLLPPQEMQPWRL